MVFENGAANLEYKQGLDLEMWYLPSACGFSGHQLGCSGLLYIPSN